MLFLWVIKPHPSSLPPGVVSRGLFLEPSIFESRSWSINASGYPGVVAANLAPKELPAAVVQDPVAVSLDPQLLTPLSSTPKSRGIQVPPTLRKSNLVNPQGCFSSGLPNPDKILNSTRITDRGG